MNATTNIYRWDNIVPLARYAHQQAEAKGFWEEKHHEDHYLMLVLTELAEAVEADRKGIWAVLDPATLDRLERLDGAVFNQEFIRTIKDTVGDELADAVIRLLDLLGWMLKDRALSETEVLEWLSISAFHIEGQTTLADTLWPILQEACCMCGSYLHRKAILYVIRSLELTCDHLGIDLMTHIELKMKYNATRPALHGKKY